MPRYITRIEGYSKKAERTFFRDKSGLALVSSRNCSQFEAAATKDYPTDLKKAEVIPGTPNTDFEVVSWDGSDYKGKSIMTLNGFELKRFRIDKKTQRNCPQKMASHGRYSNPGQCIVDHFCMRICEHSVVTCPWGNF